MSGHPLLALSREMRRNAQHSLDQHQLRAMMHLMLLDAQQAFESCPRGLTGSIGEPLLEELRRERTKPGGDSLTLAVEHRDDLALRARNLFLRGGAARACAEIISLERRDTIHAVHLLLNSRRVCDMRELLAD